MGKRSRKQRDPARAAAGPHPARAESAPPRRPLRAPADERPQAPWHPFPLVELCVLIGIVLIVIGFFSLEERRGGIFIVLGLMLGSLAGLDTVIREHFAGFRSHSVLLAAVPAVVAAGSLSFTGIPWIALVIVTVAIFAGALVAFRRVFRRSTGGLSFR